MGGQSEGVDQVGQDQADIAIGLDQALPAGCLLPLLSKAGQGGDDLYALGGVGGLKHADLLLMLERQSFPPAKKQKRPDDDPPGRVHQADIIHSAHAAAYVGGLGQGRMSVRASMRPVFWI